MTKAKAMAGTAMAVVLFLVLLVAVLPTLLPLVPVPPAAEGFGEALWTTRGSDVVVQAFIVLSGAMAVALLLRSERGGRVHG